MVNQRGIWRNTESVECTARRNVCFGAMVGALIDVVHDFFSVKNDFVEDSDLWAAKKLFLLKDTLSQSIKGNIVAFNLVCSIIEHTRNPFKFTGEKTWLGDGQ